MLKIEDRGHMVLIYENFLGWYDDETDTLYDSAPIQFENGRIEVICDDFIATSATDSDDNMLALYITVSY